MYVCIQLLNFTLYKRTINIYSFLLQAKVVIAEQTEKDIDETRSLYIPVAVNTQILFFCVADLASIDPMYQYSLEWFIGIFLGGIANAERAGKVYTDL